MVHLAVHGRMSGGTLLHELGEHTGVVGLFPLLRDVVEDALALRLALPVWNNLALVGIDVFLRDGVALQLAFVQRVQVFDRVAGQLGECRHGLRLRSALANDQFVGTDKDGFLLTDLVEVTGTEHGCRHGAVVLLVECGLYECALDGERGGRVEVLLAQAAYAVVHAAQVLGVFDAIVHFFMGLIGLMGLMGLMGPMGLMGNYRLDFAAYTSSMVMGLRMVPSWRTVPSGMTA